jgi:hypothetical protein
MNPNPIHNLFTSKGEFLEPPPKPTLSFGCELHPPWLNSHGLGTTLLWARK